SPSAHRGDALGGDPLAPKAGEGGGLLAIEVPFQAVPNGFVQHDARPARSKNLIHLAGWRRRRVEVDQCLPYGFVGGGLPLGGRKEIGEAPAATIAVSACLRPFP